MEHGQAILICEDEADLRDSFRDIFSHFGYNVDLAADGKLGLYMMMKRYYHYVLSDVRMPVMTGDAMISNAAEKSVDVGAIYFMSGCLFSDEEVDRLKRLHRNVMGVFSKPVFVDQLLDHFNAHASIGVQREQNS